MDQDKTSQVAELLREWVNKEDYAKVDLLTGIVPPFLMNEVKMFVTAQAALDQELDWQALLDYFSSPPD